MSDLSNQVAVVTGGGTGIGADTALAFAKQGAAGVIITGRRGAKLEEVAAMHPAIVPVVADVSTEEGAELVAKAVEERGGALDILVHNAGVHLIAPVGGIPMDRVRKLFDVNVIGAILLTNRLVGMMRSPSNMIFVTSPAGSNPVPMASLYGATKAALTSLTRSWAVELAPKGIRVNGVAPGWVRTEQYETQGGMTPEQVDGLFAHVAKTVPLGFTGVPEDVTLWIMRIVESSSAWFTGQIITMDGGAELVRATQV